MIDFQDDADLVTALHDKIQERFSAAGVDPIAKQEFQTALAFLLAAETRLRIAHTHQTRAIAAHQLGRR